MRDKRSQSFGMPVIRVREATDRLGQAFLSMARALWRALVMSHVGGVVDQLAVRARPGEDDYQQYLSLLSPVDNSSSLSL